MRHEVARIALLLAGVGWTPGAAAAQVAPAESPRIAVWSTEHDAFQRGDRVGVWLRTDADAFVTVFRVDTDGRVRVLFPRDPWDGNHIRAHSTFAVPSPYEPREPHTFVADDYPGVGYLFAVASLEPFVFRGLVLNDHWDYRAVAHGGRITGDPYVALAELAEAITPPQHTGYGYDIVPYFVERRWDYPRFVCYDCHRYVAYPVWDPYRDWCATFRVVIYDPPRPYAVRIYPATDVVLAHPTEPTPRFVMQPREGSGPFLTRVEGERSGIPAADRGVTGRDVGGVGAVATPSGRRTTPPSSSGLLGSVRRLLGVEPATPSTRRAAPEAEAPARREPAARPTLERRQPAQPAPSVRRPTSGTSSAQPRRPKPASTTTTPRRPTPSTSSARRRPEAPPPQTSTPRRPSTSSRTAPRRP